VFFPVDATRIGIDEGQADDSAELVTHKGALLNARVDPRTDARVREPLRLAVDPRRFHFFDRETGATLLGATEAVDETPAAVTG